MSSDKSVLWNNLGIADEISLIQELHETYGEETTTGTIVHITNQASSSFVQMSPDICGFRDEETIGQFEKRGIFTPVDKKDYSYHDESLGTDFYKVSINWDLLRDYSGLLHDREADQPYGQFKQKQIVKEALFKEIDRVGKKEITVTEKILGEFSDHVSTTQHVRGEESPIRFISTLKLLEKDGFLDIQDIQFNLDALPKPTEKEVVRLEAGVFVDEDALFYPAEHCSVKVLIKELTPTEKILKKQEAEQAVRPTFFSPKSVLPVKPSTAHIFKSFSPRNYPFILTVIQGILSLTDFSPDGKVYYQLQSPPGRQLINERSLLNRLNVEGLFSYYGEDGIYGIATIGNINVQALREIESYIKDALQQSKQQTEIIIPDIASRRGLEKKWDVLQAIWTVYESHSRADAVLVPVAAVTVKGRTPEEIDGIMDGIKSTGAFTKWERRDRYYTIETIDHERLPLLYEQVKSSYTKLASEYKKAHPQGKKRQEEAAKTQISASDIEWPESFHWSTDGRSFELCDGRKYEFGAEKSKRKDVFSALADKRGQWSPVRELAALIGNKQGYTRTLLNQLEDGVTRQKLHNYLKIEARGETSKPGAYRILPYPSKVKRR